MPNTRLPSPPEQYAVRDQSRIHQVIEEELDKRWERFQDIEVPTSRIILTSPDGTRYELTVDDAGVVGTTPALV